MQNPIYSYAKYKKNQLKKLLDVRGPTIPVSKFTTSINVSDLQPGDVIFCGDVRRGVKAEAIEGLTDGAYVHCGLYCGHGEIIDSVKGSGVRKTGLQDFLNNYSYLAIGRCPCEPKFISNALRYAEECIDRCVKYNLIDALLLPLREYQVFKAQLLETSIYHPAPKRGSHNRMFCSELVIQCFVKARYIEENHYIYTPHCCSPSWPAETTLFSLVGYMSQSRLKDVVEKDPFLGECEFIL
jgi:hypothetical protein